MKNRDISFFPASLSLKDIILAFQHLIAMFGATVLVPILVGFNPSIALLGAGIGTIIFHLVTGKIVPVFLGSSFSFIAVIIAVNTIYDGDISYSLGGLLIAGFLYLVLALIIRMIPEGSIGRILPPYVIGPMIIVIGLTLVPVALGMAGSCWPIALITLSTALIIQFFFTGFLKQMAIIIGIIAGYLSSALFGILDLDIIAGSQWISVQPLVFPKFSIIAAITIAPVVFAVFMEHIGDITANGQVVNKDFMKDPGLHRTLLGDGLATIAASLIGAPANTTYGENTGVLAITKNYNPQILRLAAIIAILLAFLGKFAAVLQSIPASVIGGISIMLFMMIALIGLRTLHTGYIEKKYRINWKVTLIISAMLIIGLAPTYLPGPLSSIFIVQLGKNASLSGISLSAITGIILKSLLIPS